MRIVIDLQGAQTESRYRGIGRYSLSLAKAIARNRGNHEVIIAISALFPDTIEKIRAEFDNLIPQENIRVWQAPGLTFESVPGNDWRREVAELIREAFLVSLKPDIIHVTSLFEGYDDDGITSVGRFDTTTPVSASLYDLIPLINSEQYLETNPSFNEYYKRKIEYLKRCSILLSISESSRIEGLQYLSFPDEHIVNVSSAADDQFRQIEQDEQEIQSFLEKHNITRPFILYSGGGDERKNLPRLIRSYASLDPEIRESHQLVLVGKMPARVVKDLKKKAKTAGLGADELILTDYVSDRELVKLYNLCKLYIFPSWHEGFGLSALEAMSCGAAVIASNRSSLPEVVGREDALFDPYREKSITHKLHTLLVNDSIREDIARHGVEQSRKFSWDISAQRAILAFEKAVRTSSSVGVVADYQLNLSRLISSIASISRNKKKHTEWASVAYSIAISMPEKRPRRLFLDISELSQRDAKTGVQRVTRSILKQFLDNPPDGYRVEPVYALTNGAGYRYAREFTAKFAGTEPNGEDDYIEFNVGDIFLGVDLQHHTSRVHANFLASMRHRGVKVFFIVYDLLPLKFPQYWPSIHLVDTIHGEWINLVACFDGAICISRAVADELAEWLTLNGPERLRPFKISWFHLGADVENSAPSLGMTSNSTSILNSIRERPSFLMVGTIEPRKGHAQALSAFEHLWSEGINVNLVIVGKEGWMVESLIEKLSQHKELNERLFWLEGISDEFLSKVYAASTCLIAASEGEGFGLPLIEAAQHNLPIIARDIPVFREVARQYALYFSGAEASDLSESIKEWLQLNGKHETVRPNNLPWLTWKQSAEQLKKIILENKWYITMSRDWATTEKNVVL